eukprot:5012813-Pyramimonas_sp.AAC.1
MQDHRGAPAWPSLRGKAGYQEARGNFKSHAVTRRGRAGPREVRGSVGDEEGPSLGRPRACPGPS